MPAPRARCLPLFLFVICIGWGGCATAPHSGNLEDYGDEVRRLQATLVQHPEDAEALRDLGVIYMRTRHFSQANEYLQQAFAREPDDPKTLYYLGLARETLGQRDTALRVFGRYPDVSAGSPYRKLMEGRFHWLRREQAREEIQARLAQEQDLGGGETSPRVVAVYPLSYLGDQDQYAPLGRGVGEMMTVDLANVPGLTIVERIRLQALLDELALSQSDYMDPSTTPRVGKLLGAGRVVGGSYDVLSGGDVRLDVALWEQEPDAVAELETATAALNNLFRLEKELVFGVIDELGIELTPEQRERIEFVPTQNLQAFLAYSQGLASEDAGRFGEAASYYRQAGQLDPGFEAAAQRAETAEGLAAAGGTSEQALMVAVALESFGAPTIDVLDDRLRKLNESLGSNFLPGQDSRKPAEEVGAVSETLPAPPPPPQGN